MSDENGNGTAVLDWTSFLQRLNVSQNYSANEETSHPRNGVLLKPERIVAIVLSTMGLFANLLSIVAISKVRGRLTSNLR